MTQRPLNIEWFPESIVRDAVGGCCHEFAVAVHRRTGWPIAALWKDPVGDGFDLSDDPVALHVFCVSPDGEAVDAEGWTAFGGLIENYLRTGDDPARYRIEVHGDEIAWTEAARRKADMLVPREHGVVAAERAIAGAERFLGRLHGPMPCNRPAMPRI